MNAFLSLLLKFADWIAAVIPQRIPIREDLENCKIISHRGEHDNISVFENTLPAFRTAQEQGIWGLECDVRWTADLVPIVAHDPDGKRLFGNPLRFNEVSFRELRRQIPEIPSLQELVTEFGGNTHLMIEIKEEPLIDADRQKHILKEQLSGLKPGEDYHFLFLDPILLPRVDFLQPRYCVLVPEINVRKLSRAALEYHCGGIAGHYYLLNRSLQRRHVAAGQHFGTGFVDSQNCLFRELNRGIDWIFSNNAAKLKVIRDDYLARSQ